MDTSFIGRNNWEPSHREVLTHSWVSLTETSNLKGESVLISGERQVHPLSQTQFNIVL